jgi:hypothetical protein
MRRKVALMEQQGTTVQPRRGAENENGSGAAPRRWLIQIKGDRVEQCCCVGVKGWEQNPTIQSFSWAAVCNQQKKLWAKGGRGPLWPITGSAVDRGSFMPTTAGSGRGRGSGSGSSISWTASSSRSSNSSSRGSSIPAAQAAAAAVAHPLG